MRLRLVEHHPDCSIGGLDASRSIPVEINGEVVIGRTDVGVQVSWQTEPQLGGRRSYLVVCDASGRCTLRHTGHAGSARVRGIHLGRGRSSGVLEEGDVIELMTIDGELALRLIYERAPGVSRTSACASRSC